jgi:hypothetical protein
MFVDQLHNGAIETIFHPAYLFLLTIPRSIDCYLEIELCFDDFYTHTSDLVTLGDLLLLPNLVHDK